MQRPTIDELRALIEREARKRGTPVTEAQCQAALRRLNGILLRSPFSMGEWQMAVEAAVDFVLVPDATDDFEAAVTLISLPRWVREHAPRVGTNEQLVYTARDELRKRLAQVFGLVSLQEAVELGREAVAIAQAFLVRRQYCLADIARREAAVKELRKTLHPAIFSVHVLAPDGRKCLSATLNPATWGALASSDFWRLRYPRDSFSHPLAPTIAKLWRSQDRRRSQIAAILFRTQIAIVKPDCASFMLIERINNEFCLRFNVNLECAPDSFSARLPFAETLTYEDLPNLGLYGLEKPKANKVLALLRHLGRDQAPECFGRGATRNATTASTFERLLRSPALAGLTPDELSQKVIAYLTTQR